MRHLRLVFLIAVLLAIIALLPLNSVSAYGHMVNYTLTCSSFTASGMTDQLYGGLEVDNQDTGDYVYGGIAAVGGAFTGTITFPAVP